MTPASPGNGQTAPRLDAAQLLQRLLEVIRSGKPVADYTPEWLGDMLGVPFQAGDDGESGFGGQLTADWSYNMLLHGAPADERWLDAGFDSAPGTNPPMTDICAIDFDRFAAELEKMGFARKRSHGEHGRHLRDDFTRDGLRVEVYPRGEADAPAEKIGHACVKRVLIR